MEEREFRKEIVRTQKRIIRLLGAYVLSLVYLCGLSTAWFVLLITGHL